MSELSEYERLRKEEQDYLNGLSNTNTNESTEPQSLDESSRLRKEEQDYLDSLRVDTPSVYEPPEQQTVLSVDAEEPKFDNYGAPLEAEKNDEDGDGVLTLKQLSEDPVFMKKVETYYTNRMDSGAREEGQSDLSYLEDFMSDHYRAFLYRDTALVDQIFHLKNASKDERLLFGDIYSTIEKNAPSVFSDEMGFSDRAQAVGDALWYSLTSASTVGTILASGGAGSLAGPVGTVGGAVSGVTAVKAASTAAIRSVLLSKITNAAAKSKATASFVGKALVSKPMAKATIASVGMSTVDDLMVQTVEKLGSVDPTTQKYDPTVSPSDLDYSMGRAAVAGISGGVLQAAPVAVGAYAKLKRFNSKRAESMDAIKEAQKKYQETLDGVESVTSTPSTGILDAETIKLADAINKAYNNKSKEPLMKKVEEDFVFIDNILKEDADKAINALQNAEVFEKMGKVSIQLQKDLDSMGLLDVLGERATATYRGILGDKGSPPSRITAVVADGLDGIENIFDGNYAKTLSPADEKAVIAVLDEALIKSGVDKKDFVTYMSFYTNGAISIGDMTRKSMSTAAKTMAKASELKRQFFGELYQKPDETMRKILDSYLPQSDGKTMRGVDTTVNVIKTLDRVRTASLTSQLVTTVRNIYSGGMMVAGQTGVNLIDSTLYHTGRGLLNLKDGNISGEGIIKGIGEVMADSFSVINAVTNQTKSQILIDATMEYTPQLHKALIRSQPDLMDASKGKFSRYANTYIEAINHFNIASDSYYRRAFYMSSLDKRFKNFLRDHKSKHGSAFKDKNGVEFKNVTQFIESGRILDKRLIAGATEDALKMTFAATPENAMGKKLLSGLEAWRPITTVVMPFPRFFVNAIRTTYEFSPLNPAVKMTRALGGKEYTGAQHRESVAQGLIGTAAFAFAYNYLSNKEDNTPWYDVGGVDIRALWPASAYFAAMELFIAMDQQVGSDTFTEKTPRKRTGSDIKQALETLTGFPVRSGENVNRVFKATADLANENLLSLTGLTDSVSAEKKMDNIAEFTAEYLGGLGTPLRMIKDVSEQLSVDSRRKDIRAGLEDESSMTKIFSRMASSNLPENIFGSDVQEPMPIRQYMYEDAEKSRNSPLARFAGLTFTDKTGELEREVARVGLKRKDLLPYTGSGRLDSLQTKHYRIAAVDSLRTLINTKNYNSDIDPATGKQLSVQLKLRRQKGLIAERSKHFRDVAKETASREANKEAAEKAAILYDKIELLKKENATKEELAEARGEYAAYVLYHISSDEQKVKWDNQTSSEDASAIEQIFKDRHEEALRKVKDKEALTVVDYMYLRGPTIAEQKSFGFALAEYKFYKEDRKASSLIVD